MKIPPQIFLNHVGEGRGREQSGKFNPPPHKSNVTISNFFVQKKEKLFLACMSREHSYIADISS